MDAVQFPDIEITTISSAMSSSSGYLTASETSADRTYNNAPDTISVYADITDIDIQKGHDNPEISVYTYITNKVPQRGHENARCCTTYRRYIYVILTLSVAVLVGSGIVTWICLGRVNGCIPVPPTLAPQPARPDYIVRRGDNVSMYFTIHLVNPREIRLLKETSYANDTLFNVTNLNNNTLQTVGNDQMNFTVSVKDEEIEASVYMYISQCRHEGNYYVLAISDTNGFKSNGSKLRVLSECPCRFEFNITSFQDMKCSFPDAGNTSIIIAKASGGNPRILVNWTDIIRPIDVPSNNGFSASWLLKSTLVVEIKLGRIDCNHEGYYNINLIMNDTSLMYEVYVHVIDYPRESRLTVLEGGITEDKGQGQMLCEAATGCTKTPFLLEYHIKAGDKWEPWFGSYNTAFEPNDQGWYSKSFIVIIQNQFSYVDRKKFRCSYKANGKTFTSDTLCVRVIPANFCKNNTSGCNYEHPFFCNKYITCTTVAEERACPPGLHFLYKGDCGGKCQWLTDEYERDCNGYCVWPQNVNCAKPTNYCD